jgi:lysophospholipase L1-like esterase
VTSDALPTAPVPDSPADGDTVDHGRPRLQVGNSFDPNGDELSYDFVVYDDASLTHVIASAQGVSAGPTTTAWTLTPTLPLDGGTYWWRCGVDDGYGTTWSQTRTFLMPDIGNNTPDRYLGFGDSITKGSQVWNGFWIPEGLAYEPELEIAILAFFGTGDVVRRWVDGGRVHDVADTLGQVLSLWTPAYCLLNVGVLDARDHDWAPFSQGRLDSLEQAFTQMSMECRQRQTIPVLSTVTPLHPAFHSTVRRQNVDSLNARIRLVAETEDAILADHYEAFMAYDGGNLDDLFSADGLHPSDEGSSVMAGEWFMALTGREPGSTEASGPGDAIAERARTPR